MKAVPHCRLSVIAVIAALTACGTTSNVPEPPPKTDGEPEPANHPCPREPNGCWVPLPSENAPQARSEHIAVWTGEQMLVYGGQQQPWELLATGGAYSADKSSWFPLPDLLSPGTPIPPRSGAVGVWTGGLLLVWGGHGSGDEPGDTGSQRQGGRYDPASRQWSLMSMQGVPSGRDAFNGIWTGKEMIVWGGTWFDASSMEGGDYSTGGRYDPAADAWQPTAMDGAPSARYGHAATWTGSQMIVWGGGGDVDTPQSGGAYDPLRDEWTSLPTAGAPSVGSPSAVWTGTEMIVWGDGTGGIYDPASESWRPMSSAGAGSTGSANHSAIWTGSRMIVWGGTKGNEPAEAGAMYDPKRDEWAPVATDGAPSSRVGHTAVWTGAAMIVWGGSSKHAALADGAAYYPPRSSQ